MPCWDYPVHQSELTPTKWNIEMQFEKLNMWKQSIIQTGREYYFNMQHIACEPHVELKLKRIV